MVHAKYQGMFLRRSTFVEIFAMSKEAFYLLGRHRKKVRKGVCQMSELDAAFVLKLMLGHNMIVR